MQRLRLLRENQHAAIAAGGFIVMVVIVVIALALLPIIIDFTQSSALRECTNTTDGSGSICGTDPVNETANLSSTQITLLDLTPTFYLIGLFVAVIAWLAITRSMD